MPTLPAAERRTLELAGLAVPFVQVTGSADGPTLTVIVGVHGCEYAVALHIAGLDGGCVRETVTAPADGVVIFVTSSPAVADDGLLLGLGAA